MGKQFFDDRTFNDCCFFAGVQLLLYSVTSFLQRSEVCQYEFGVYHFNVANRINRGADVMNVGILKTTHDLDDSLDFADMMEELIPKAFTCARTFYQPCNIYKLDCRRCDLFRARNLGDPFQSGIGHDHHADIRINRAEGIILRRRFVCACNRIKKRRFPDVW